MINHLNKIIKEFVKNEKPNDNGSVCYIWLSGTITVKIYGNYYKEGEKEIEAFCTPEVKEFLIGNSSSFIFTICDCGCAIEAVSNYCESCKTESCHFCSKRFPVGELKDNICPDCIENKGTIPEDSDKWYPFDQLYSRGGKYFTESVLDNSRYISYQKIKGAKDINSVGFELELDVKDVEEDGHKLISNVKNILLKRDHSLGKSSIEVISNYGDLDQILNIVDKVIDNVDGYVPDDEYGLHVHLTKKDDKTNARMISFWNDPENYDFLSPFLRRDNDYYAFRDSKRVAGIIIDDNEVERIFSLNQGKYNIVRLCDETLEVRGFLSSTDKEMIKDCIKLSYYTYEFCSYNDNIDLDNFLNQFGSLFEIMNHA